MENEKIILESKPISIASYTNYKEAVFLISVLDEPDEYGRIIPEEAGEKYYKTIIGYPIVAKLKKNLFGQPIDFGGHELKVEKTKNGKKSHFDTIAIGSVVDAWVEEREVDGYEGTPKCILIKSKLWTSRFPEYFKVFDKLWEDGNISSSWELTASEVLKKGKNKIYKVFEFIGNCVLGSYKIPAVPGAGVIEYAELDGYEAELADALEKDIVSTDVANLDIELKKEEEDLEKQNEELNPTVAENTKTNVENKENIDTASTKIASEETKAEISTEDVNTDTASLTEGDLFLLISKACKEKCESDCGYISYWFPEEHTVWFKDSKAPTQLDYKLFTYSVENDEVSVSEPTDVKLTVSVTEINTVLAEKENKINTLTAELEIKENAVISAGETIGNLKKDIAELKPYKAQVEKAEQERIEAEIAEEKDGLKKDLLKGGLFSEEEIASAEIAELIERRDKSAIKTLIADRYIASFNENVTEDMSNEETNTATASLEVDEVNESPSSFMTKFLLNK